jgi:hypothetical protein
MWKRGSRKLPIDENGDEMENKQMIIIAIAAIAIVACAAVQVIAI